MRKNAGFLDGPPKLEPKKSYRASATFLVAPRHIPRFDPNQNLQHFSFIVGGSGAEFINHSCDPNFKWRRIRRRLFYYGRRKIKVGEELTVATLIRSAETTNYLPLRRTRLLRHDLIILTR